MKYRALGNTGAARLADRRRRLPPRQAGRSDRGRRDPHRSHRCSITASTSCDNCWDYNGGESERRLGEALRDGYRDKVFLMTKIDGRTAEVGDAAARESLRRLQTDHLDLLQFHEIIRMDDPERVFAQGGALEAMLKAREQGKLRFIGFTGHKSPAIHAHMFDVARQHNFHFDTVQMPLNVMDAHYDSFERDVLPIALRGRRGRAGHEDDGRPVHPGQQDRLGPAMPALRDEPAGQRDRDRHRPHGNPRSGAARHPRLPAD